MTKQDILDYFSLIDFAYNESGRLESLSRMLDELLKEQEDLGTELTNAVELIHKKNERIDKLLKEQKAQKFFVDESGEITPLPVVIRCKDCEHRGNSEKCVLSAISEEKKFPLFILDNRGEWFCADGKRKDT